MSKNDLVRNLGRIGFSGTSEFMKVLEDKAKAGNLIGQFGVGFYSVFMVATKIKVYSKSYQEEGSLGWVWESDGYSSLYHAPSVYSHSAPLVVSSLLCLHLQSIRGKRCLLGV